MKMDGGNYEEPIAVIGYSCRFPGANNPEEFWDLLLHGKDATGPVPQERPFAKEISTKHIKRGGFLKCAVDCFDAAFFNVTPDKASFLDPQQRLLLECTWEALEHAAINPHTLKNDSVTTGVFIGVWSNDYRDILQKSSTSFSQCEYHVAYLSFSLGVTAARISYFLGLRGPHGSVDAGCCSSLYSVHQAVTSLRRGETNLAIAGGVNLILHPAIGKLHSLVLAPDGKCKSFDAKANGFARAEGCGVILLKKLSDAVKDGNKILGVIRGVAVNADASLATFGTPCRIAQAKTITEALKDSRLGPEAVSYVEAHGTGTEVGDTVEISAISAVYSTGKRPKNCPLIIASAKPNIGHCEAAAGMASIIKVLLAMKNHIIPPHINFTKPHPCINLHTIPAIIPIVAQKWEGPQKIVGISTFGLGGHNAHMILEGPHCIDITVNSKLVKLERPLHILTLSAKCEGAFKQIIENYKEYLKENNNIGDVTYTANSGRAHFQHRLAVIGQSSNEIRKKLEEKQYLSSVCKIPPRNKNNAENIGNKIAFLFSDHTSGYGAISRVLYETNPIFKESIDLCCSIGGIDISNMIPKDLNNNIENLSLVTLFSIQYSIYTLWISFGIKPDAVLGYGAGEYVALVAAGKLKLKDAIELIVKCEENIKKLPNATFLALNRSAEVVDKLIERFTKENHHIWLDIAAINNAEEVVVVGENETIDAFADFCEYQEKCKTRWVSEYPAIHSKKAKDILKDIEFHSQKQFKDEKRETSSKCRFISCVESENENILFSCVNFLESFSSLWKSGIRIFIEISTNPMVLGMAMSNCPPHETNEALWLPSLRKHEDNWSTLLSSVAKLYLRGIDIDWEKFDEEYQREKLNDLPKYPFQRQRYWVDE